ncbi:hypothetical protein [Candidatus Pyrohabitans sp.]
MGVTANPVTITWVVGIGLGALIASALLLNKRTRRWSDNKIFFTSITTSFSVVLILLKLTGRI